MLHLRLQWRALLIDIRVNVTLIISNTSSHLDTGQFPLCAQSVQCASGNAKQFASLFGVEQSVHEMPPMSRGDCRIVVGLCRILGNVHFTNWTEFN